MQHLRQPFEFRASSRLALNVSVRFPIEGGGLSRAASRYRQVNRPDRQPAPCGSRSRKGGRQSWPMPRALCAPPWRRWRRSASFAARQRTVARPHWYRQRPRGATSQIGVNQGDEVTLEILGVNGAEHPSTLDGYDINHSDGDRGHDVSSGRSAAIGHSLGDHEARDLDRGSAVGPADFEDTVSRIIGSDHHAAIVRALRATLSGRSSRPGPILRDCPLCAAISGHSTSAMPTGSKWTMRRCSSPNRASASSSAQCWTVEPRSLAGGPRLLSECAQAATILVI